jgi:hypothetical protein
MEQTVNFQGGCVSMSQKASAKISEKARTCFFLEQIFIRRN